MVRLAAVLDGTEDAPVPGAPYLSAVPAPSELDPDTWGLSPAAVAAQDRALNMTPGSG